MWPSPYITLKLEKFKDMRLGCKREGFPVILVILRKVKKKTVRLLCLKFQIACWYAGDILWTGDARFLCVCQDVLVGSDDTVLPVSNLHEGLIDCFLKALELHFLYRSMKTSNHDGRYH